MLKITQPNTTPFWIDIAGRARVQVKPVTVAAIIAARQAAADAIRTAGEDASTGVAAFTRSLARWGILAWEGIGDADGKPVDPSPENIDALLEVLPAFDAIDRFYVLPALIGSQEKNG
jgi:hypothetical protein